MAIDFTEKLGPLPVWGWGLLGGGSVAVIAFFMRGSSSKNEVVSSTFDPGGYQTSGIKGGETKDEVPTYDTNTLWIARVGRVAAQQLSKGYTEVYSALYKWTSGQTINADEQAIVNAAVAQGGAPPEGTQGVSAVTPGKTTGYVRTINSAPISAIDAYGNKTQVNSWEDFLALGAPQVDAVLSNGQKVVRYEKGRNDTTVYAVDGSGNRTAVKDLDEYKRLGEPGFVLV